MIYLVLDINLNIKWVRPYNKLLSETWRFIFNHPLRDFCQKPRVTPQFLYSASEKPNLSIISYIEWWKWCPNKFLLNPVKKKKKQVQCIQKFEETGKVEDKKRSEAEKKSSSHQMKHVWKEWPEETEKVPVKTWLKTPETHRVSAVFQGNGFEEILSVWQTV